MEKIYCRSLEEIPATAKKIVDFCKGEKIWVFKGDLGAGKTTMIKAVAEIFGIVDRVSSPTFSLINEYQNDSGKVFYHFDFYRIDDPEEVLEIGVEEYFYSGHYCWIEWAEKIPGFIPPEFVLINIEIEFGEVRKITLDQIFNRKANG